MKRSGYDSIADSVSPASSGNTPRWRDVFGLLELVIAICAVGASIAVVFIVAVGGGPIP